MPRASTRGGIDGQQYPDPQGRADRHLWLVDQADVAQEDGDVPDGVGVGWHNRKVLNFTFGLGRKAEKWDQCDENLKSFAGMAVASLVGCGFCLDLL
jgi:hypothetical protein